MTKDLTSSRLDRQNILNNELAVSSIQGKLVISTIPFEKSMYLTKEMVALFFDVDTRTIERYITVNSDELKENGYKILKGESLKVFLHSYKSCFGTDINVGTKITKLGIFDFRAFLNIAMLLAESDRARMLRQMMLDVVIDLINKKTGGGTKYINQRDRDFVFASLQEENYRRQFTDALKKCVEEDRYKYAYFTDLIYVSIFKEKAKEYKKILDLKASDSMRDTLYSEVLDLIAAYENGFAEVLRKEYEKKGCALRKNEVEQLFHEFETLALWEPLIKQCRIKMASRDMALREAFHYRLAEYIQPLDKGDYQKFLGATGDELERLMLENREVLKRLKERE